jgi:hypothetical protein
MKAAVEQTIKAQIDKASRSEKPTETHQTVSHVDAIPSRDDTITKISSVEFYQDVGEAMRGIIEKRAAKKGKGKNDLPPFMKAKGKEEEVEGEEEEEEESEEKPKKGKKKKEEEDEGEPKFPIFGKKPRKAE